MDISPVASRALPQRQLPRSRETLEKTMLKARKECFQRVGDDIDKPMETLPQAKGIYLSDADRFHSDTAGEERRRREEQKQKEHHKLNRLRDANLARDAQRWQSMSDAETKADVRILQKRELGLASKKNSPSLPFNPITLQYSSNFEGTKLQHSDDLVKYRAALRTHNLYTRANGEYNVITGEPRLNVQAPGRPKTPDIIQKGR